MLIAFLLLFCCGTTVVEADSLQSGIRIEVTPLNISTLPLKFSFRQDYYADFENNIGIEVTVSGNSVSFGDFLVGRLVVRRKSDQIASCRVEPFKRRSGEHRWYSYRFWVWQNFLSDSEFQFSNVDHKKGRSERYFVKLDSFVE